MPKHVDLSQDTSSDASDMPNTNNTNKTKKPKKVIKTMDKNELLEEMRQKQLDQVETQRKLTYADMRRVCKFISTSIFDDNKCCIWNSYVTNENNENKGSYINFYYRKKKAALHRLLYINFVEDLSDNEYIKFNCENKGRCCTVSHLKKFKYNKTTQKSKAHQEKKTKKIEREIIDDPVALKKKLRITFD